MTKAKAYIAVLAGALAVTSMPAFADDAGIGGDTNPSQVPTIKEKQRAVEAATRARSEQNAGKDALGERGPPKPAKSWEEMTPEEQDTARKRWLLNSGDFGPPGRGGPPRSTPKSLPTTKDRKSAAEAAEKEQAPEKSMPAKISRGYSFTIRPSFHEIVAASASSSALTPSSIVVRSLSRPASTAKKCANSFAYAAR